MTEVAPMSVRMTVVGGGKMKAELIDIGREGKKSFDQITKASGSSKAALQNTAYQVQDVFVQVAGGTSVTRALSQQLPQLLSGFGLFGVLAGTASAALIPLISSLFNLEEGAADAQKQVDALMGSIKELKAANAVYSTEGIQALIEKYGEINAAVLLNIDRQHQLAEAEALKGARDITSTIGSELVPMTAALKEYDAVLKLIEANNYGDVAAQKQQALLTITQNLNDDFGITVERAREIAAAFDDLRAASTVAEMATATARLTALLDGTGLAAAELYEKLVDAEDALLQVNGQGQGINSWLDAAISGTSIWAGNLWEAARAAGAARSAQLKKDSAPGMNTGSADWAKTSNGILLRGADLIYTPPKTGKGTSGRGGGASKGQNDSQREAMRIYEQTRTEAEKYAAEQAKINELLDGGFISADTYQRALDMVAKKYKDAGDAGKFFTDLTGDLKEAFLDLAIEGEASFDKIAKSIERAILQAVIFGDGPLGKMFGGGLTGLIGMGGGGDMFANIAGARAGGGSVVGGLSYLVGENGPEVFAPNSSGMIHKAGSFGRSGGSSGRGTTVQIIDQRSGGESIQTERKTGPDGREMILMTVRDATGRGELDGAQRRFGARPVGVKR